MFEIGQLTRLPLGYVGENGTRTISIDVKAWLDEYPGALIMIQVIRPVDHYKYPAAYTKTDDVIHWTVDGSEVMYAGKGFAQISLYNPDTKQEYKSRVVGTIVAESLDGFNDILLEETDPASKWVNRVLEAAESAETSKNDAANSKEEAAAAVAIVATQKNEALIAIRNEGTAQTISVNEAGTQQAQFVEAKGEEVLGKIPEDYTELSKTVATLTQDIASNTAPAIIPTAQGAGIVAISDSANRPLAGLRLYGKTTQNGTPTPDAPVPLVNVGAGGSIGVYARGKNLLKNQIAEETRFVAGITFVKNADGSITANGTSTDRATINVGGHEYPAGEYIFSQGFVGNHNGAISYAAFERDGATVYVDLVDVTEQKFVLSEATYVNTFCEVRVADVAVTNHRFCLMIRRASVTDDAFESYKDGGGLLASTPNGLPGIPVTSGGNYTDANGQQWICDEIDFGRGVYVQRVGVQTLNGTETWYTGTTVDGRNNRYTVEMPDKMPELDNATVSRVLCNAYPAVIPNEGYIGTVDYGVQGQNDIRGIMINDARYPNQDLDGFKASLAANPITVMYILATPIETPLSADEIAAYHAMISQKPTTTVYNDAGAGLGVDYIADTRNYIDQRISALLNA